MKLEDTNVVGKPETEILDHVFECHEEIRHLRAELASRDDQCECGFHDVRCAECGEPR